MTTGLLCSWRATKTQLELAEAWGFSIFMRKCCLVKCQMLEIAFRVGNDGTTYIIYFCMKSFESSGHSMLEKLLLRKHLFITNKPFCLNSCDEALSVFIYLYSDYCYHNVLAVCVSVLNLRN